MEVKDLRLDLETLLKVELMILSKELRYVKRQILNRNDSELEPTKRYLQGRVSALRKRIKNGSVNAYARVR